MAVQLPTALTPSSSPPPPLYPSMNSDPVMGDPNAGNSIGSDSRVGKAIDPIHTNVPFAWLHILLHLRRDSLRLLARGAVRRQERFLPGRQHAVSFALTDVVTSWDVLDAAIIPDGYKASAGVRGHSCG